jgi:hypothetical protein
MCAFIRAIEGKNGLLWSSETGLRDGGCPGAGAAGVVSCPVLAGPVVGVRGALFFPLLSGSPLGALSMSARRFSKRWLPSVSPRPQVPSFVNEALSWMPFKFANPPKSLCFAITGWFKAPRCASARWLPTKTIPTEMATGQHQYQRVIDWAGECLRGDRYQSADSALDHLNLGSALLRLHEQACTPPPALVKEHLDQAVRGLQRVCNRHHLPRALLTRADWHRLNGDLKETQSDLDNGMLASLMGGMTLYQADCHLAYARLHLDRREPGQAQTRLDTVRTLVDKSRYHRIDEKLAGLDNEISDLDRVQPATEPPAKGRKRRK